MYQLKRTQFIPADLQACWDFFSSPQNLQIITPDYMEFKVLTENPAQMYTGLMIAYKVKPLLGIPLNWVTEIRHVEENTFFVDEQRIGPYKLWHHEHHFREVEGGVEMTDIVSYVLAFGWIGKLAHSLLVKKKLTEIFEYRYRKVEEIFGEWKEV